MGLEIGLAAASGTYRGSCFPITQDFFPMHTDGQVVHVHVHMYMFVCVPHQI